MSRRISKVLIQAADELETWPSPSGYGRYIPFIKELAVREEFCLALHSLKPEPSVEGEFFPPELKPQATPIFGPHIIDRDACRELISNYRLPDKGKYCVDIWLDILEGVWRNDIDERLSPLTEVYYQDASDSSRRPKVGVEFDFEFPGERGKHVVYHRDIQLKRGATRPETSIRLQSDLQVPLKALLLEVRSQMGAWTRRYEKLGFKSVGPPRDPLVFVDRGFNEFPWFDVRLKGANVIQKMVVVLPSRTIPSIMAEIVNWITDEIKSPFDIRPGQGRNEDATNLARWHSQRVFEGLSFEEIAQKDGSDLDIAETRAESIARRLREVMSLATG